jgi:glycosyltransferase involved in cell wall biosynthesis
LGLDNVVEFVGHQSDPLPFYEAANAFVLPSLTEGSPLALLEAMMARVPISASAVGGVPETVSDESSALLVPSQDPSALATAMQRLVSDHDLGKRLSAAAHHLVATRHTPESYARTLLSLYQSLLSSAVHVR